MRPPVAGPFYAAILDGDCTLSIAGRTARRLGGGDFVLVPAAHGFTMASLAPPPDNRASEPVEVAPGVFHLGEPGAADTRMLVGHCAFGFDDAALLVSLLPGMAVVRGEPRLTTLVALLGEEARAARPGRDTVLARLLEVLLIEAFRATGAPAAAPGLLRGLADARLAAALRRMHAEPARAWTVGALAREAALSRSTFFERFRREVGVAPMEYLLAWRMAMARDMLRGQAVSVGEGRAARGLRLAQHVQRRLLPPGRHLAVRIRARPPASRRRIAARPRPPATLPSRPALRSGTAFRPLDRTADARKGSFRQRRTVIEGSE